MLNGCNVANRTIFTGDNLDILRGINSECVDLIYLDPPFNSNRAYAAPLNSEARGAEFSDVWTLDDMKEEWIDEIELRRPSLYHLINGAKLAHSERMAGYLTFMSMRLLELRRVLKPTGSIYLHCDPTASHYLQGVMDAVFGWPQFQAEISWRRTSAHNDSLSFGNVRDTILFYSHSGRINTADIRVPLEREYVERFYRFEDERGQYRLGDLTAPRLGTGETGQLWRGYDPNPSGRQWNAPLRGHYAAWINETVIPGYLNISSPLARLDALDAAGLIHHPDDGGTPRLKRYLAGSRGRTPSNEWTDIRPVSRWSREYTGWRTQKPIRLLERIINASSNPGDLVLDPFCGCATACIASERLHRQWIGIDMAPQAAEVLNARAKRELQIPMNGADEPAWEDWSPNILREPPRRNDLARVGSRRPAVEQGAAVRQPERALRRVPVRAAVARADHRPHSPAVAGRGGRDEQFAAGVPYLQCDQGNPGYGVFAGAVAPAGDFVAVSRGRGRGRGSFPQAPRASFGAGLLDSGQSPG